MAASAIYNTATGPLAPNSGGTGPTDPTTPPLPGPQGSGAAASPLHDAVRQAVTAHPDASADQIAQGLIKVGGVDPTLAQRVVSDVMGKSSPPPAPPAQGSGSPVPNPGAPAQDATSPPMAQASQASAPAGPSTTPPLPTSAAGRAMAAKMAAQQASIDKGTPGDYGPTASIANANWLAGQQAQADETTPPAGSAPAGAPGTMPAAPSAPTPNGAGGTNPFAVTPPLPDFATMPPADFANWMANRPMPDNGEDGATAATDQTTPPPPAAAGSDQAKPAKGPNKWATVLENLAPAAAALMIGSHNPAAGAAFLGSWQGASDQAKARAAAQQQQDIVNKQKEAEIQNEKDKVAAVKEAAAGKLDASSQRQMGLELNNASTGAAALAIINKYDPDGSKLTGMRQILIGPDGKVVDVNPYSTKAGTLAEKSAYDFAHENHWSAQDTVAARRADQLAKQVGARVDELEAVAGLDKSRAGYIDLQTKQLIPMDQAIIRLRDAQSKFLGVRTTDQPGLDRSLEDYRQALGGAATMNADTSRENADTNRLVAGIKAAMAREGIRLDEARIPQIMAKDPTFNANMQLLKQAISQRQQAQLSQGLTPEAQKRMVDDADSRIEALYGQLKGRLTGNGGSAAASTPAGDVPTVPDVPASRGVGKPTPRSMAGKAMALVGTTANSDKQPACADAVCKIARSVGLPVPQTRSAGEMEKQLPSKGWREIPIAQAGPNDIITSRGTGQSGRHVQWSLGNGNVLEADSKGDNYSNIITRGRAPVNDPSAKAWHYDGTANAPRTAAAAASRATQSTPETYYRVKISTGPVTLGKLTREQFHQLSPADQAVYYQGMQQLKAMRK